MCNLCPVEKAATFLICIYKTVTSIPANSGRLVPGAFPITRVQNYGDFSVQMGVSRNHVQLI
jgi:hypothetical protein